MRLALMSLLVLFASGCASSFSGEWLEDAGAGVPKNPTGERRMALKFEDLAVIRYGSYNSLEQVVDAQSVQTGSYFIFDGGRKAQFGSMIARVDGDHLYATVSGDVERRFVKIHSRSIFPPPVQLPDLTQSQNVPSIFAAINVLSSTCIVMG
jgi:hypothetical protein